MQDRIEKEIELKAPVSRVWRALTDHEEFGEWFRAKLDQPFEVGEVSKGKITYPGYEHYEWQATVVAMEPERLFAFTWHPGAVQPSEAAGEPATRVEFHLQSTADGGTHLRVVESGFSALPEDRRETAFRQNEGGWEAQMGNIRTHVDG